MDTQYKDIQIHITKLISRVEELEMENKYLKGQQQTHQAQLAQNVRLIDAKYQKLYRKYMKCLFKYGMYQSCLTNVITQFNKLLDRYDRDMPRMSIQYCIEKFGIVYENNKIIDEPQMEEIIKKRSLKESEEIHLIFFPKPIPPIQQSHRQPLQEQSINMSLQDLDSLQFSQNYTFQSHTSSRRINHLQKDENISDVVTDHSEETMLGNLTTQRYLEKLQNDNGQIYNEDTVTYPKTIRIDKLLQMNSSGQLTTDRQKKQGSKLESAIINPSPNKNTGNTSFYEDRVRRFDVEQQSERQDSKQRRRSRADRMKQ